MSDFDAALTYALERIGRPSVQLKPQQRASIQAVYDGRDVFVWLPTGFGESICFTTLPFAYDHKLKRVGTGSCSLVLIISPLISLMVDQVESLRAAGVRAAIVSSGDSVPKTLVATPDDVGKCSLLFCAPEALVGSRWRDALEHPMMSERIVAIVVDEAHCVSKWSDDFRPAYSRIHEIRALVPQGTPCMACTATVTRSVREEVVKSLEMAGCDVVSTSPDRPNIFYTVCKRTDMEVDMQPLVESLKKYNVNAPRTIVYCRSLNMCADLYAHFHYTLGNESYYPSGATQTSDNRLFAMYHAHTPKHNKEVVLKSMMKPEGVVRVVFATVALGMGVNLQNTNATIHYGAPQSIDDYFQESGRGGRSGENATSVVYWKPADCPLRTQPTTAHDHEIAYVRRYLENTSVCRRQWLLEHFDPLCAKPGSDPSKCCDVCLRNIRT